MNKSVNRNIPMVLPTLFFIRYAAGDMRVRL